MRYVVMYLTSPSHQVPRRGSRAQQSSAKGGAAESCSYGDSCGQKATIKDAATLHIIETCGV